MFLESKNNQLKDNSPATTNLENCVSSAAIQFEPESEEAERSPHDHWNLTDMQKS